MSATRHTVTEPKPPFWSRPRVFIGVCVAIVSGLGSALYTQDSVKSAATLVTTTQQPAAGSADHGPQGLPGSAADCLHGPCP